jgi:tetratricopeptide (TPR) repeat protein
VAKAGIEGDLAAEAIRLATQALAVRPVMAPALLVRGRALLATGKSTETLVDFKQAASVAPANATAHFQLARAYRQLGMNREAQDEEAIFKRLQEAAHTPKPPSPYD